jgi:hypothetical protein
MVYYSSDPYACKNENIFKKRKIIFFFSIKIITFSNLIGSKRMANGAGGGFEAYVYPEWSTIVGWFIFVGCIIPIPLVYIVNYIKEYRAIVLGRIVRVFDYYILSFSFLN